MNNMSIMKQVRTATRGSRLAVFGGFLLGGLIPAASFLVAHNEVTSPTGSPAPFVIVLGGLMFSALTVFQWGRSAFQSTWKALGFVTLTEGVMVFSGQQALSVVCLAYLVVINGLATGCRLAIQDHEEAPVATPEPKPKPEPEPKEEAFIIIPPAPPEEEKPQPRRKRSRKPRIVVKARSKPRRKAA